MFKKERYSILYSTQFSYEFRNQMPLRQNMIGRHLKFTTYDCDTWLDKLQKCVRSPNGHPGLNEYLHNLHMDVDNTNVAI